MGGGGGGGGGSVSCGFGCGEIVAGTELGSTRGTNMAGKGRDVNVEAISRRRHAPRTPNSPSLCRSIINYSCCNGYADEVI
jgi:hypothetical protein